MAAHDWQTPSSEVIGEPQLGQIETVVAAAARFLPRRASLVPQIDAPRWRRSAYSANGTIVGSAKRFPASRPRLVPGIRQPALIKRPRLPRGSPKRQGPVVRRHGREVAAVLDRQPHSGLGTSLRRRRCRRRCTGGVAAGGELRRALVATTESDTGPMVKAIDSILPLRRNPIGGGRLKELAAWRMQAVDRGPAQTRPATSRRLEAGVERRDARNREATGRGQSVRPKKPRSGTENYRNVRRNQSYALAPAIGQSVCFAQMLEFTL